MKEFCAYIYYRLYTYYDDEYFEWSRNFRVLAIVGTLVILNILSIIALLQSKLAGFVLHNVLTEGWAINRFLIIPLMVSPIFIVLFLVYRVNKKYFKSQLLVFKESKNKKLNFFFWFYIVFTGLFLIGSIMNPFR